MTVKSSYFSHSTSRRRFGRDLVRAAFGAAAVTQLALPSGALAQNALPAMGNAGDMTAAEERRLGNLVIAELYRDPDYVDDPVISEYVNAIWSRLRDAARKRGELTPELDEAFAWRLVLGRDKEINAFALPGGYMGLLTGMVGVVDNRDELASVMAHETGHIVQRHIARSISDQKRSTPLSIAALLLGVLAATQNPQAGAAVVTGGQAALVRQQLAFSRSMEREADRVGYAMMVAAGYRPQGFVSMFEKLLAASRLNDNGDWPFLRSHPLTTERIADMQLRAQNLPPAPPAPTDWEALLLAARARALSKPGVDALQQWAREPGQSGFSAQAAKVRAPALYAAAQAQAELRDLPQARALAAELQKVAMDERGTYQARMLQAELALRAGDGKQALELLPAKAPAEATGAGNQTGRAILLLRARALTQAGRAPEAISLLQAQVANHPQDDGAWAALAHTLHASGQELRALRAEGEVRMVQYDYAGAVARFQAAQDYARKHSNDNAGLIDASIVDARLSAARSALKAQKKDEEEWS